ncbi:MAG TPA: glycosyltransferase [Chloroflexota bacterium]|nr:glycosyltransferase [Chloroflexota bacterium]
MTPLNANLRASRFSDQKPTRDLLPTYDPLIAKGVRIALYSHDTMGLGHMRRNLLIAETLAKSVYRPTILLVAGAREVGAFPMPSGVDCLSLPALRKDVQGQYHARSLDVSLKDVIGLRANIVKAALTAFDPDVLIVDNVPRGAVGELEPSLRDLRARGRTRCVLGLRDILDEPTFIRREWRNAKNEDVIRSYYDAIWVYGDQTVYDMAREYGFAPDVASKLRYTGYLDQRQRQAFADDSTNDALAGLSLPPGRLVLCLLGGGQDGGPLAEAFVQAQLPPDTNGILLTGPYMPAEIKARLHHHAASRPRVRIVEFDAEPTRFLSRADQVIAMGGYNTVCEILSFSKRALIVPRTRPRLEQWIRAERLRNLGLLDTLRFEDLSPRALTAWLHSDSPLASQTRQPINLTGLTRLPGMVVEVLRIPPSVAPRNSQNGESRFVAG